MKKARIGRCRLDLGVYVVAALLLGSCGGARTTPWHSATSLGSARDESRFDDLPPASFAPGGRLYSVESVVRAVNDPSNPSSNLVVALKHSEGVVVVTTVPSSPYIYDEDSKSLEASNTTTKSDYTMNSLLWDAKGIRRRPWMIQQLDRHIWGVTAGPLVDGRVLQHRMKKAAVEARQARGPHSLSGASLARALADAGQIQSQTVNNGRLLCATAIVLQQDGDEISLWRVDPHGQFWNCHAVIAGRGAGASAEGDLLDRLSPRSPNHATNPPSNVADHGEPELTLDEICQLFQSLTEDQARKVAVECLLDQLRQGNAPATKSEETSDIHRDHQIRGLSLKGGKYELF